MLSHRTGTMKSAVECIFNGSQYIDRPKHSRKLHYPITLEFEETLPISVLPSARIIHYVLDGCPSL